jgi:hypothetical protein
MDELLKDAIADAKAVRETALANAKLALEEAFTPRLKSMLSKKIQSEMEDAVDELEIDDMDGEDGEEEEAKDEMAKKSSYMGRDGEEMDDEDGEEAPEADMEADMEDDDETDEMAGMKMSRDGDEMDDEDDEMEDEGVIEINGVKYAPVMEAEEDEEAEEVDEMKDEDDDEMDEDLDLDEILKELEEVDEADEVDEEVDQSSGIGSGDNKKGDVDKSSGIGTAGKAKMTEAEDEDEAEEVDESEKVEETDEVDEDVDLEEVIKALSEDEVTESTEEVVTLKGDLKEHRKVVRYLREKLNEVNLLNAKLLFTNKLFRAFGMTNEQKMKVVETFDRAKTLREIKLVYTTVAENFGNENIKPIKETRTKGSASKAVASTKSTKQEIISESDDMKQRFQKLANIL